MQEDPFNAPGNAAAAEAAARTDVYSDDEIDDDFEVRNGFRAFGTWFATSSSASGLLKSHQYLQFMDLV